MASGVAQDQPGPATASSPRCLCRRSSAISPRRSSTPGVNSCCRPIRPSSPSNPSSRLGSSIPRTRAPGRHRGQMARLDSVCRPVCRSAAVCRLNTDPKPFIWTKCARDILQKVIRADALLSSKKSGTMHQVCGGEAERGCRRRPVLKAAASRQGSRNPGKSGPRHWRNLDRGHVV